MLIDFCHYSVGSSIKTDKVSFDGYEVTNLTSANPQKKSQGFLSDHFVKPPVNITIQFPCNVSLYRVVIDPVIGRQQSHDIKIFTAATRLTETWLYGGKDNTMKIDGLIFNPVGHVSQSYPTLICMQSQRFNERKSWKRDESQNYAIYNQTGELRSNKPGSLTNASHLTVCVLRTRSGCSAAIKRLEIWGIPSSAVPSDVQERLRKCYNDALFPVAPPNIDRHESSQVRNNSINANNSELNAVSNFNEDELVIPEEFKDQITFEIMACPVILPSGKVVDQSTLDRFVNSEASWGRPPSDPFTGLEFTQGRQPLPNTALKARIDDFTFKHSNLLTVAKTLGSGERHCIKPVTSSRLVSTLTAVQETSQEEKNLGNCSHESVDSLYKAKGKLQNSARHFVALTHSRKRKCDDSPKEINNQCKYSKGFRKTKEEKIVSTANTANSDSSLTSDSVTHSPYNSVSTCNHKDVLSFSLDDALKNALGSLPSFTTKVNHSQISSEQKHISDNDIRFASTEQMDKKLESQIVCNKCGIDCDSPDVVKYKILCGHLVCRQCVYMQRGGSLFCVKCNRSYSRDKIVRVF